MKRLRLLHAHQIKHRGVDVHRLHEMRAARPAGQVGMVEEQRDVGQRLVKLAVPVDGAGLADHAMLAEEVAVVGGDQDGRVLQPPQALQAVQEVTQPHIRQRHLAGVEGADVGQFLLGVAIRLAVDGPADALLRRVVRVHRVVGRGRVERLMRIEAVDHQQEVVQRAVAVQPAGGGAEGLRGEGMLLALPGEAVRAVAPLCGVPVVLRPTAVDLGVLLARPGDVLVGIGDPVVVLLPADELPAVEGEVVVAAAPLEEMVVIGDQHRRPAGIAQDGDQVAIIRLQRAPAAPGELVAPGPEVAPGGHAGVGAQVGAVEGRAHLGQALKVGCADGRGAVGLQVIAPQRVDDDEDDVHAVSLPHREPPLLPVYAATRA